MMASLFDDYDEIPQNPEPKRGRGRPKKNDGIEKPKRPTGRPVTTGGRKPSGNPRGRPRKERAAPQEMPEKHKPQVQNLKKGQDHPPPGLTEQQKTFCENYVLLQNTATQAAISAGYAPRNAGSTASHMLCNSPFVKKYVAELREKLRLERMDKRERWLLEIERMAYYDIAKLVNDDGTIKSISDIDADSRAAIKNLTVDETTIFGIPCGTTKKITMHDKLQGLKLLGQANCWLVEEHRHEHKGLEQLLEESRELYVQDQALLAARRPSDSPNTDETI